MGRLGSVQALSDLVGFSARYGPVFLKPGWPGCASAWLEPAHGQPYAGQDAPRWMNRVTKKG